MDRTAVLPEQIGVILFVDTIGSIELPAPQRWKTGLENRALSLGLAHVEWMRLKLMRRAEIPVYRVTPLSEFTSIARSSSARKIPDNNSIVRA